MSRTVRAPAPAGRISVIVAIHNAWRATARCLESLAEHGGPPHRVLLMNDASTDPRIAPLLADAVGANRHFTVHENARNLGYTRTINRGCELAGRDDVVLLNSDTRVTAG